MGIEQLLEKAATYMKEQDLETDPGSLRICRSGPSRASAQIGRAVYSASVAVADILVNMQMDVMSIIAALLA